MDETAGDTIPDIFNQLEIGITLHDPETGEILDVNDRLESLYGYSAEELRRMEVGDYSADSEGFTQEAAERRIRAAADGEPQTFEWQIERADGEHRWVRVRLTEATLEGDSYVVAEIRDISDQKERERRTRAIFDQTYQFTGLLEPDGTLIEANQTALDFGGLDAEDVIGKRVWETYWFRHSESTRDRARAAVERAADGEFVRTELPVQGDGREAIIDFSVRPVEDDTGDVQLLIPEGRDITALKEREQQLAETNDLLSRTEELADVGGWELDTERETLQWTEGTRWIHDLPESYEPTLEEAIDFVNPRDRDRMRRAIESCRETGEPYDIEVRLITATGRERWVKTRGELVEKDGRPTVRGLIQDITERKEREQRLMVLNRVLRHNLRNQLNVILGCAKNVHERLDTVDAAAEQTVSMALVGERDHARSDGPCEGTAAETAPGERNGSDEFERRIDLLADFPLEDVRTQLEHVISSSEELTSLAEMIRQSEQVFDVSQLEQPVPVRPLLEEIEEEYERTYPDAEFDVGGEAGVVRGNRGVLRVALEELVDNAIKHGHGSAPRVRLEVSQPSPNRVRVAVSDDGPGIPEEERETLIRGTETPLIHGSGVGLWLVNWATTRLDGTLDFADGEGQGSTVTLTFPAASQST